MEKFKIFKKSVKRDGIDKLHIISDFDGTLTKPFVNGRHVPSLISVLYNNNHLSADYSRQAKLLYAKYHPYEIDPHISIKEKKRLMEKWWTEHFTLLMKSGLEKNHIDKAVNDSDIVLRDGSTEFFKLLAESKIPLVIMSSSGLGSEAISLFLKHKKLLTSNIHIISNSIIWDKNGKAVGIKKPIIHAANKDETVLQKSPVWQKIKDRNNIILLGNSISDLGMITGFPCRHLIKIGFINNPDFDINLPEDSGMGFITDLIKDIS